MDLAPNGIPFGAKSITIRKKIKKCDYNPTLVRFNKIQNRVLFLTRLGNGIVGV